ncbi:hypothetical protein ACFQGT_03675 [Natrialbaceae archaeon GCM10025810]|uniref:hypothetical protein n=1 Tax=Halovalidus salilacus TaxID=3075124 RepID=UPI0036129D99
MNAKPPLPSPVDARVVESLRACATTVLAYARTLWKRASIGVPSDAIGTRTGRLATCVFVSALLLVAAGSLSVPAGDVGVGTRGVGDLGPDGSSGSIEPVDAAVADADRNEEATLERSIGGTDAARAQNFGDDHDEDDLVSVRYDDEHVVSGERADDVPSDPYVRVNDSGLQDDRLVVDEHGDDGHDVVQTTDGDVATVEHDGEEREIRRLSERNPDLVIVEDGRVLDELEVNRDEGIVQTVDGGQPVTVGNHSVVYEEYTDYSIEIGEVDPVAEGETLEVPVTVRNDGYGPASDEAVLRLPTADGTENVTKEVSVDGGERANQTFEYETGDGDSRMDDVEVEIGSASDSAEVDVARAGVAVEVIETNTPVEGEDLELVAELERIGNVPDGAYEYVFGLRTYDRYGERVGGDDVGVELEPGETLNRTFTYETTSEDVPEIEAELSSEDDSDSADVTVVPRDEWEDSIRASIANATVDGDELEVDASFEYDGELPGGKTSFPANFTVDGERVDGTNVTIDNESAVNESFAHALNESERPVTEVGLETPGENDSVEFEREFAVDVVDVSNPVTRDDEVNATIEVENRGETPGRDTLEVEARDAVGIGSSETWERDLELGVGESTTENVSFNLSSGTPSNVEVRASTSDDDARETVNVRTDDPWFVLTETTVDDVEDEDDELVIESTVRNEGGSEGTQEVELEFDDESLSTEEVALEPDEEQTVSATVDPTPEPGAYAYAIGTENDATEGVVTVEESAVPPDEKSDTASGSSGVLDGLPLPPPWLVLALLGLIGVGGAVVAYRNDPSAVGDRIDALRSALEDPQEAVTRIQAALRGLPAALQRLPAVVRDRLGLGGNGNVVVENALPRPVRVRISIRTDSDVVFLEDFDLSDGERRVIECLPASGQFEVGTGVEDITAHTEVFQSGTDTVGIRYAPEGITIGQFRN